MKTIENLSGELNADGSFVETRGVVSAVTWQHPEKATWWIKVLLGQGGLKFVQGQTEVAIPLDQLLDLVHAQEPGFLPQLPPLQLRVSPGGVELLSDVPAEIRFTPDGSEPTESSDVYTAPIAIVAGLQLRAVAYRAGWRPSQGLIINL